MRVKGSDFVIDETAKPSGMCIWDGCGEKAAVVMDCKTRPIGMEVCAFHAEKFSQARITPDGNGISVKTFIDPVEEDN